MGISLELEAGQTESSLCLRPPRPLNLFPLHPKASPYVVPAIGSLLHLG